VMRGATWVFGFSSSGCWPGLLDSPLFCRQLRTGDAALPHTCRPTRFLSLDSRLFYRYLKASRFILHPFHESTMTENAWKQLLAGAPWFRGEGSYPIQAYSEFMPPPLLGLKPYQDPKQAPEHEDGWGWEVSEYEEAFQIKPGLAHIGSMLLTSLRNLGQGN